LSKEQMNVAINFVLILGLLISSRQAVSFEAASIKPSLSAPGSTSSIQTEPGRIMGRNVTLRRCVRGAYDVPETLVGGGPKWADEDRYDIDATAAGPANDANLMIMLQSLLADRFQLVIHRERREVPGYALVLAKGGVKAEHSAEGARAKNSASRGSLESEASTMANLAQKLSDALHTPVADFTGLDGKFSFKLSWNPDETQALTAEAGRKASAEPSRPSIFTALQEQLGLKLESRKVPVEVIVIDSATKPSAN
jgi:uncharacterized protein (TIGR03435 family)